MHQSVATITGPEFINLQPLDINPLMSKCEVKVLYVGENRNRSYISKEVATEMSKTLRGAPIVGYYRKDVEDFGDHGERVTIDADGVKFDCLTVPYGFVAPDAKVWFQEFEDYDDFGNSVKREYLMTTGYLWTGQFPECKSAVEGDGKPHSMELDGNSLDGEWSKNLKTDMEFFIINDAIFSKLCILGEDVEPCFEGSSVTAPKVSTSFSLDEDFKQTLFSMMKDLKFALEGGQSKMENLENSLDNSNEITNTENEMFTEEVENSSEVVSSDFAKEEEKKEDTSDSETPASTDKEDTSADKKESDKESDAENEEDKKDKKFEENPSEEFKKEEEPTKEEAPKTEEAQKEEDEKKKEFTEEDKKDMKCSLEDYEALQAKYSALEVEYQKFVEFKNQVEDEKKDALINSFYMLSDEDKKDVIENKSKYSLDDIEAKLSVICVRKKVSFELDKEETPNQEVEDIITTFSLEGVQDSSIPAWISAVKNTQDRF